MREMTIAAAILDLAKAHLSAGATLLSVRVETGPMQVIKPDALQWAWRSLVRNTVYRDVTLKLTQLPWRLRCSSCGAVFASRELSVSCACGFKRPSVVGGDELRVAGIEMLEAGKERPTDARVLSGTVE